MGRKIILDDIEYDVEHLSDNAKVTLTSLQFVSSRITELTNMSALLQRAKNSYVNSLKKEMLTEKAGILLEGD